MRVISELRGPLSEAESYQQPSEGFELLWDLDDSAYLAREHLELSDVSWSYGNLILRWYNVIEEYPGSEIAAKIGSEGRIIHSEDVAAIADYLVTIEPRLEHGQDFVDRLEQLKRLFGQARSLSGGAVYTS